MRWVDRVIGVPLCWIAGIWLRTTSTPPRPERLRRILVIKFFGMGSIILTGSPLRHLKRVDPDIQVTYLTFASNVDVVGRLSIADEVLSIDSHSAIGFLRDSLTVLRKIRAAHFDAVIDFEFFSKFSTLLSALSGAPIRGGFSLPTRWRQAILTHWKAIDKHEHVSASFAALAATVTRHPYAPTPVQFAITGEERSRIANRFGEVGGQRIVINVNTGATFLERRWKKERFAAVIDALTNETGIQCILTGSSGERTYVQSVIACTSRPDHCINAAGELTPGEFGALLQSASLFLSSDSGPVHLAALLDTPSIALYGPEDPVFYRPLSANSIVFYKGISCSPCMNIYNAKQFRCPYHSRCMDEIHVDEVLAQCTAVLNR